MKVKDYLFNHEFTGYFIIDSHQGSNGLNVNSYFESDYGTYEYNPRNNSRIKTGSVFLYRRPGTSARDRQFHIYGGGVFDDLIDDKKTGIISRKITKGFRLATVLNQRDSYVEEFSWRFKSRKPYSGWRYFFTQYGITEITKEDFYSFAGDLDCFPIEDNNTEGMPLEDTKNEASQFTINYQQEEDLRSATSVRAPSKAIIKIDFAELNKRKKTIGTLGELLVFNEETEKLKALGLPSPQYVADTIGDGLGYDILSYDETGKPIFIEVKTTTTNAIDGFYMSNREIEESKVRGDSYRIYRVYNLNERTHSANICVFSGIVSEKDYFLKPTSYIIYRKSEPTITDGH